jgi:hypothetical protein
LGSEEDDDAEEGDGEEEGTEEEGERVAGAGEGLRERFFVPVVVIAFRFIF